MISKQVKQAVIKYATHELQIEPASIGAIVPFVVINDNENRPGTTFRFLNFEIFDKQLNHRAVIRASKIKPMLKKPATRNP